MSTRIKMLALIIMAIVVVAAVWRYTFSEPPAPELDQSIDTSRRRVEVSFDYLRQGGMASNQLALWITDKDGKIVKTLFATNFTAGRGGWRSRKESLPRWVADSGIDRMDKARVDAVSRATPRSGTIRCAWYCEDDAGKPVPEGRYTINLEGSLRWENRALFRGDVSLNDGGGEMKPIPVFFGDSDAERGMLTKVVFRFIP
jgi:Predicted periplasmic protein